MRSPAHIRKVLFVLRSWLDHNGVEFTRLPKVDGRDGVTIENERVPSAEDLRRLLGILSDRGRICVLLMAQSGVRPGVLGSIDASDGLTLGDLPELDLARLAFALVPFMIRVRSTRDKFGKGYVTPGGPELAEAIMTYLRERIVRGETLTPESPVVASLASGVGRRETARNRRATSCPPKASPWTSGRRFIVPVSRSVPMCSGPGSPQPASWASRTGPLPGMCGSSGRVTTSVRSRTATCLGSDPPTRRSKRCGRTTNGRRRSSLYSTLPVLPTKRSIGPFWRWPVSTRSR